MKQETPKENLVINRISDYIKPPKFNVGDVVKHNDKEYIIISVTLSSTHYMVYDDSFKEAYEKGIAYKYQIVVNNSKENPQFDIKDIEKEELLQYMSKSDEVTTLVEKKLEHEKMLLEKYRETTGRYSGKGCNFNEEDDG